MLLRLPRCYPQIFCASRRAEEPASKIYLAEAKGGGKIENDGKVYEPKQGSSFSATGTVMATNVDAHQSYVLSTGGGLYLNANTEVRITQFEQERFPPGHLATDAEPSVSHVGIEISRGMVGVCASQMVSGTTLVFSTPLASVNIRGHQVAIQVTPGETTVSVLEGSVTVRIGDKDPGGVTLQPGERVVIHPGPPGQPPVATVAPIDGPARSQLEAEIGLACSARKTVTFETDRRRRRDCRQAHRDRASTQQPDGQSRSNQSRNLRPPHVGPFTLQQFLRLSLLALLLSQQGVFALLNIDGTRNQVFVFGSAGSPTIRTSSRRTAAPTTSPKP